MLVVGVDVVLDGWVGLYGDWCVVMGDVFVVVFYV